MVYDYLEAFGMTIGKWAQKSEDAHVWICFLEVGVI